MWQTNFFFFKKLIKKNKINFIKLKQHKNEVEFVKFNHNLDNSYEYVILFLLSLLNTVKKLKWVLKSINSNLDNFESFTKSAKL